MLSDMQSEAKRARFRAIGLALFFAVVLLVVFWEPVFRGRFLWSPDNMPYVPVSEKALLPSSFMGSWTPRVLGQPGGPARLLPRQLLFLFLPPLACHVASYMLNVILLGLACFYFLRGRGVRGYPVYLASLALAFSGHSFTLIAAGHLGKFDMMPMAVLMLAFLDRAVCRRSFFYFALTGMAAALGLSAQFDVMVLFGFLAIAYGLYKLIVCWDKPHSGWYMTKTFAGVLVAAVFFLAVGSPALKVFFGQQLSSRQEQIEMTTGTSPEQEWEFATNWSLPPEEILGFVAPSVFGIESGDSKGPYWGRLGRTMGWLEHHQGLMNLRQHSVYLGVLQLVFGFFAVAAALRRKKSGVEKGGRKAADKADNEPAVFSLQSSASARRADIFFWAGVFLVALGLALGRYFPLYRLFYMLPYVSKMRAPVKFMHLMEVALAFLFAFGLQEFFSSCRASSPGATRKKKHSEPDRQPGLFKGFLVGSLICAAVLLAILALGTSFMPALESYWSKLGLGNYGDAIGSRMKGALIHGAALFLFCAALFWGARRFVRNSSFCGILPWALLLVLALDIVSASRPYVKTVDLSAFFASNPVIERLKREQQPYRLSCPFQGSPFQQWKMFMLRRHLIDSLESARGRIPKRYLSLFETFREAPVRLWQITNTRFILGPTDRLSGLTAQEAFETELFFDVDHRGRIVTRPTGGGRFSLVRFAGALPRAIVVYSWQASQEDEALSLMSAPEWNPFLACIVSGDVEPRSSSRPPTVIQQIQHHPQRVEIEAAIQEEGLLLLNDGYDPGWKAFVDGKETDILRCNGVMRGVLVPPGRHDILFVYRPYALEFFISAGALALLGIWGMFRVVRTGQRPTEDETNGMKSAEV